MMYIVVIVLIIATILFVCYPLFRPDKGIDREGGLQDAEPGAVEEEVLTGDSELK